MIYRPNRELRNKLREEKVNKVNIGLFKKLIKVLIKKRIITEEDLKNG